jgi:predicted RNA binding protein YcfA (HicA-like mRNA interferase family)
VKAREAIKIIEADGWRFFRQVGSHRVFKKDGNPMLTSVPDHQQYDLTMRVMKDIYRTTGVKLWLSQKDRK